MEDRLRDRSGRLIYAGAGTSGRLAVQDGAELMPTFSWPHERLLLLMAGGDDAHAAGRSKAPRTRSTTPPQLIQQHEVGADDVLIAVAASGTTPFTLACLREAQRARRAHVGIANNRDTPLLAKPIIRSCSTPAPEPIAGSTRMNAGTAQRITLNLLSSLLMILLGRVYEGLMVDVQASNQKLAARSESMLRHLTGRSAPEVRDALRQADGSVKLAALLLEGASLADAQSCLERAGGQLRAALAILAQDRGRRRA